MVNMKMQIIVSICLFSVHYALFDIVPHHEPGSTARLSSPTIRKSSLTTSFCFSFTYAVSVCCCVDVLAAFTVQMISTNSHAILILEKN